MKPWEHELNDVKPGELKLVYNVKSSSIFRSCKGRSNQALQCEAMGTPAIQCEVRQTQAE